ncbi:hypothetical protein [Moorena producens]|uniref:hypothetical protein n=1 Tax=Moorena producens TaxID=1155739 RepID=UPI003C77E90A
MASKGIFIKHCPPYMNYQTYGKLRNLSKALPTLHELLPFACMALALGVALYLQAIQ